MLRAHRYMLGLTISVNGQVGKIMFLMCSIFANSRYAPPGHTKYLHYKIIVYNNNMNTIPIDSVRSPFRSVGRMAGLCDTMSCEDCDCPAIVAVALSKRVEKPEELRK